MLKILALREKFDHMGTVSGYDALYNHFGNTAYVDSVFCNFKKIYPRGIGRALQSIAKLGSSSTFYNAQSAGVELKLLAKAATKNYDIIHYTYGEPYYGFGSLKTNTDNIVITNHQPTSWWQLNTSLLKKFNTSAKVIALSDHDALFFNEYMPGKAICIPHGVDTFFFKPAVVKTYTDTFKIIFSGRYLRDMVTLAAVVKKLSAAYKNFFFDIIYLDKREITEACLIEIMALANVQFHANISENNLLELYQSADCCLIPLNDCTANNAILEAMALGMPIVFTHFPSIK